MVRQLEGTVQCVGTLDTHCHANSYSDNRSILSDTIHCYNDASQIIGAPEVLCAAIYSGEERDMQRECLCIVMFIVQTATPFVDFPSSTSARTAIDVTRLNQRCGWNGQQPTVVWLRRNSSVSSSDSMDIHHWRDTIVLLLFLICNACFSHAGGGGVL